VLTLYNTALSKERIDLSMPQLIKTECLYFVKSLLYFGYTLMIPVFYLLQYLPAVTVSETDGIQTDPAAFARVFSDSYGTLIIFFTSFLIVLYLRKDIRMKQEDSYAASTHSSAVILAAKTIAMTVMLFTPVMLAAIAAMVQYAVSSGTKTSLSLFMFLITPITWLLPSLLFTITLNLLITLLSKLWLALPIQAALWIFSLGSTADTGDYNTALAIRHSTLGGYESFRDHLGTLIINRLVVTGLAILFFILSFQWYERRRVKR